MGPVSNAVTMSSELEVAWDGGVVAEYARSEVDAPPSESGRSTRASTRSAKAKSAPRAKRGKAQQLSNSFTCWRNTPETWYSLQARLQG